MQRAVLVACVLAALATVDAQQPPTPPPAQPTFRTSATLATIDAVVTDDEGRFITDLTRDEFEISVGGKKQELQQAVYVPIDGPKSQPGDAGSQSASAQRAALNASAVLKQSGLQPHEIARTIAFVVDDLNLSFESMFYVRRALEKYVDKQLQAGDLVAIIKTASGIGALQQFTTDKRLLHLAISRLQWDFRSSHAIGAFTAVEPNGPVDTSDLGLREEMVSAGSLSAVQFIARGVRHLPGRKSIVLLSEGYASMFKERMEGGRVWNALTRMLDQVNRAGVVLYTIDARGLQTGGLTAEDNPQLRDWGPMQMSGLSTHMAAGIVRGAQHERIGELLDSQEALTFIAAQTGGLSITNNNDLNLAIQRVLDDQRGYYLLGYGTSDGRIPTGWNQDNVRVRVKRPGLHVRSRQGFFGPAAPGENEPIANNPLLVAALSPFGSGDITVRLTTVFGHDGARSSFVRSLLFIDPADVQFSRDADGRYVADLQLMVLAVSDNGEILGDWRRALPMRLTEEQYEQAREHGIVYSSRMQVKRPGAYQVRAAVLDTATGKVGSGSQFLEVPQVGSGRLAISGVMLQGLSGQAPAASDDTLPDDGPGLSTATLRDPAVRLLSRGARAAYAYEIYDGLKDSTGLTVSTTLVRNGKPVYQSPATPVPPPRPAKKALRVIPIAGSLDLGRDVPPGPYSLQVVVERHRSGKIDRRAAQWVDFEVR